MAKAIGIDLGTTTSSVAYFDGKQARLLVVDERERVMPTVVQHDPTSGKVSVGIRAYNTATTNPQFTYRGLKRLLGRKYNDPLVQTMSEHIAYNLSYGPDGEAWVTTPDGQASPEELLSHVLRRLKEIAQTALGEQVSFAVVGVPASFGYEQKLAVRRACDMAGLQVRKLVTEPTAAAVAYGMERGLGKTVAVYDLGGGTFDATILKVADRRHRALGTAGDAFLGGEDFDTRLVDHLSDRFREKHGFDPRGDRMMLELLRLITERAKIELSSSEEYRVFQSKFAKDVRSHILIDLDETVTRAQFEELVEDLIDRTRQPCLDALAMAKREARDIDDVVLVGGMTWMPRVREAVREIFGREPAQSRISPVEAVTIGCSMLAASIAGETRVMHLEDIVGSNFGLEASGGTFVPVIRRGTRIPFAKTVHSAPADPAATQVAVRVFYGDAALAKDNAAIGVGCLGGLPEDIFADKETAVTFDLDDDAILTLTLTHVATGRTESKRFDTQSGLDPEDVAKLRGLDEDEDVGPEPDGGMDAPVDGPVSDAASDAPEPVAAQPDPDLELDPPELPSPDSAPGDGVPAPVDAGPAEDVSDDEPPPMPGEPRWAKPETVAAE